MGMFDKYDLTDVDESFPIPELPGTGLILLCGTSGSGKSTILRKHFGSQELRPDDRPLYLNFSSEIAAEKLLLSCGLRTIPSWKRSYHCLSTGEQHRAYCALLLDRGVPYLDEFTSVVDRDTAKALAFSIQRYFRENQVERLVIASCHRDIIEWLSPDHIYDTDLKTWEARGLPRGSLQRPKIQLNIRAVDGAVFWPLFKKHHYLSRGFNKSANSFVAYIGSKPVGFCAILRFPNANFKNGWRGHRTVILPEFQGIGIGTALSDNIAQMVVNSGGRFFSKTSHPAFGIHRECSPHWKPTTKNKKPRLDYVVAHVTKEDKHKMQHRHRICYSHEYLGNQQLGSPQ